MTKKILLAIVAVAVIAFLSITIYKNCTDPNPPIEIDEDDDDDEQSAKGDPMVDCDLCHVAGNIPGQCGACKGKGITGYGPFGDPITCPICFGRKVCFKCNGTGHIHQSEVGNGALPPSSEGIIKPYDPHEDTIECAICNGSGKCSRCAGDGKRLVGDSYSGYTWVPCDECIQSGQCRYCFGRGYNYK